MEHHDLTDDLDRRLRAARPTAAHVDEHAFDGALLARVRQGPVAARRAVPRAVTIPVTAGVIVVATAAVMLGGGPGDVGGPSSAAAITQQTLTWLEPPTGTILHTRSIETTGTQTTTREFWESADDPAAERELFTGAQTFEQSGDAIYDPATNTIYDPFESPGAAPGDSSADDAKTAKAKIAAGDRAVTANVGKDSLPAADPVVNKVRTLLEQGFGSVTGRESHDGIDSWAISFAPDTGRPSWTLWVSAADGKPIELRDSGSSGDQPQVIRWSVYEVLAGDSATQQLVTLTGAHPTARVVHDPAEAAAARQRLFPPKP